MLHVSTSREKAIKAVLVYLEIQFPKIHDLDRLRELIPEGWRVKEKFPHLYDLSVWSVEARYPGHTPGVTEHEAREILRLAAAVFDTISAELEEQVQQNSDKRK